MVLSLIRESGSLRASCLIGLGLQPDFCTTVSERASVQKSALHSCVPGVGTWSASSE